MKRILFFALLVAGVMFEPSVVRSQTSVPPKEEVKIQMWPDKIWTDLSRELDRSGTQLTNVIFDQIDDFTLLTLGSNNNKFQLAVKRSVFDNQDILNTYTVNDQLSVNLGRSATEFSIPLIPSVTNPLNFNLGVGGKLVVNHIRQVFSTKYPELPKVDDLNKESNKESEVYEQEEKKWWDVDSSWKPRLSKFWNPLSSVWRIPWTKEGLEKLKSGDLISYSSSGYLSVGLESGFVPMRIAPGVDLSVGIGVQVYVKGEFRITLLKESDRYVRVKVTKIKSLGQGLTAGAHTNDIKVMDGLLLFEGKKLEYQIKDQKITVIPFKISIDRENKNQLDVGYRFDLSDPYAEEAFEKAMRGNFKFAEDLSKTNPAVTHLLTRDALEKRRSVSYQLGLKWIYNFGRSREKKDLWATIQRPDGTKEIFKSSLQMAKGWTTLWGSGEKQNFLFTTLFDKTAYENKDENSFQLVSEALYEDVNTSGKEMRRYIHDIQSVVGGRQVLPELPLMVPKENSNKLKQASYKRSSFYFGQYFTQKQVMKFLMTDSEKAWVISNRSFDYLPNGDQKSGRVKRFFNHWMKLQKRFKQDLSSEEMIDALQDLRLLFRFQARAIHAMKALVFSLDGEEVDFFITGTNRSFGRIQFRGRVQTNAEKLLQIADETVDFENRVGLFRPDLLAKINDLKVEQRPDLQLKVSFTLPKGIKYLYFKLLRSSGWKKIKTARDLIYVNKDRFKEGQNEWIIGPDSQDPLDQAMWTALTKEEYYTLQMSGSFEAQSWGRVESFRFKFDKEKAIEPVTK
jgi:hypothetical protein